MPKDIKCNWFRGLDGKRVQAFPVGADPKTCFKYTGFLWVDAKHPNRATLDGAFPMRLAIWKGHVYERHLNSNRIWGKPYVVEEFQA